MDVSREATVPLPRSTWLNAAQELDGVFLCRDEFEAAWFVQMNNTSGPVDVWVVTSIKAQQLIDGGSGFDYFPGWIPPSQVALADWPPSP